MVSSTHIHANRDTSRWTGPGAARLLYSCHWALEHWSGWYGARVARHSYCCAVCTFYLPLLCIRNGRGKRYCLLRRAYVCVSEYKENENRARYAKLKKPASLYFEVQHMHTNEQRIKTDYFSFIHSPNRSELPWITFRVRKRAAAEKVNFSRKWVTKVGI